MARRESIGETPSRLGRYDLLKRLGVGGMGEVWVGRTDDGRLVAIKRMLAHLSNDWRAAQMFLDEAKIASTLDHPNVVRILEVDQEKNDVHWIAMELVLGETLARMIDRAKKLKRPVDPRLAAHVIAQAARGVHHAHTRTDERGKPLGIIHRDVTPPNVMVTDGGQVKVLDFGIAKAMERSSRTEAGAFKGKIEYLSPEQILGAELDPRSDVFALGAVLFELVTQRKLFARQTIVATLAAISECRVPPPSRVNKEVPPGLDAIALKALSRDREQRYKSAAALADDIDALLRDDPITPADVSAWVAELCPDELAERKLLASRSLEIAETVDLEEALERAFEEVTDEREAIVPDFSVASEGPTQVSRVQKDQAQKELAQKELANAKLVLGGALEKEIEALGDLSDLAATLQASSYGEDPFGGDDPFTTVPKVSAGPPPPPPKSTVGPAAERARSPAGSPIGSHPTPPTVPLGVAPLSGDDDDEDLRRSSIPPPRSRALLYAGFTALTAAGALVGGSIVYRGNAPPPVFSRPLGGETASGPPGVPPPRVMEDIAVPTASTAIPPTAIPPPDESPTPAATPPSTALPTAIPPPTAIPDPIAAPTQSAAPTRIAVPPPPRGAVATATIALPPRRKPRPKIERPPEPDPDDVEIVIE